MQLSRQFFFLAQHLCFAHAASLSGMSLPFGLVCPTLNLIFKARSKAHLEMESFMGIRVLALPLLHGQQSIAFDTTRSVSCLLPP